MRVHGDFRRQLLTDRQWAELDATRPQRDGGRFNSRNRSTPSERAEQALAEYDQAERRLCLGLVRADSEGCRLFYVRELRKLYALQDLARAALERPACRR